MELNLIKDAHILDILFDGRNKDYGAYELRKTYNRRMVKSMIVTGSVVLMVIVGGVVMGRGARGPGVPPEVGGIVELQKLPDPPVVLPPLPKPVVQQVAMIRLTTLRIVPDNQVKKNEQPPENTAADHVSIGTETKPGVIDDITGPPAVSGAGQGVVDAPKKTEGDDRFIPIEKEAEFPGGPQAWARFLNKTLTFPEEALNINVQGTVMVQFVVDVDGTVSDVKAISGPETGGLREEAVRVIKKSGKWVPALQNGRSVKAYRRQPVTFRTEGEN